MKLFRSIFLFFIGWSLYSSVAAQVAPYMYWVQFTDKNGTPYSVDSPEEFLSERAIARRDKQNIQITSDDLPVNPAYVDSLKSLGLTIHNTSKWLNGAVIISTDNPLLDTLHHLSFIAKPVRESKPDAPLRKIEKYCPDFKDGADYGLSKTQIEMLHGEYLHSSGYRGDSMLIAILDAGFDQTIELESLQHLWENDKIIAWRDFVKDSQYMFYAHRHGTLVLSILAGIIPDNIYGSAPEASYLLVRTENGSSEYLVEEYNWVSGAEYADSMGADVINSSLGYSIFDNPAMDHSYSDMNGRTTPVSRGAAIAARKGIIISNSAGNSGDDDWFHILAPSDADSILTVGAVDTLGIIAAFSSRGSSYDGRVKPEVCAIGKGTIGQVANGGLLRCSGTSCSSPIIAGMAACLWQSVPEANAWQVRKAIIESSNRYNNPDSAYGYGIPDFLLARLILNSEIQNQHDLTYIKLFPIPIVDYAYLTVSLPWLTSEKQGIINLFDLNGRVLISEERIISPDLNIIPFTAPANLEKGYYIMRLTVEGRNYDVSFIKF